MLHHRATLTRLSLPRIAKSKGTKYTITLDAASYVKTVFCRAPQPRRPKYRMLHHRETLRRLSLPRIDKSKGTKYIIPLDASPKPRT
jgi:hypothetical protein